MDDNVAFINGTRSFTGNLSMGNYYINNLLTGNLGGDAVNRTYVDSKPSTTNLSAVYPVGFVVITSNNVNPGISLAWGNWSSLGTGYVLVGI
jgi:hypothetical protein